MNPRAAPFLLVVQPDAEMESMEIELARAVLAIDISPSTANPSIGDIYVTVEKQFGALARPTSVRRFHSDFIIQFATAHEQNDVLKAELLCGEGFNMILIPWSKTYKSNTVSWQTEVAIDISGLPPHACYIHCLQPLLSPHCKIQTCRFNKQEGTSRVVAFALSTSSIPTYGHVAVQYILDHGVSNDVFPATMQAYPAFEAPEFRSDSSPVNSPGSPASYDTADEVGVDRELLWKAYDEQHRANLELERSSLHAHARPIYGSASSSEASEFDNEGWESDRSWKLGYQI